ncbi:MAG TPA: hypothetical protein VEE84_09030 [Burkholderiaceae bacterium]|nr:hypothetical protein [Burkholderiaceae bacterium]
MRLQRYAVATFAVTLATAASAVGADAGVAVEFSQPGVYGRIYIGQYPQPQLTLSTPVIAEPPPVAPRVAPEPIYLWVPPEHQAHWKKYCHEYRACGHPVYFVRHDWYEQHVMVHRHEEPWRDQERAHARDEHGERERDRVRD